MAWVTPVTNRNATARMTYLDMNRISGNISYLYNYAKDHGYDVQGDDVSQTTWTQNDIISYDFWYSMTGVLGEVREAAGLDKSVNYPATNYYSVNSLERYTLYTWMEITEPPEYGLLQNREGIQLQTESGADIEAGIL
ncbi:MAG: hypothetical protein IKF22_08660 [Lachnospiraceae bacterium]|nr:hypothetical protein [Lachnospiraceae bacterium]